MTMDAANTTPISPDRRERTTDTAAAAYALTDGRSRQARLGAAAGGILVLAVIWTGLAVLRDDATQKLAARAAATAGGSGLAAQAAAPAHPQVQSHFLEFIMISFGAVGVGILLAYMGTEVLGLRLRAARQLFAERDTEWASLAKARDSALGVLVGLVAEQHASLRSVGRLGEVARLQAEHAIELRAAAQHDIHGYWSPKPSDGGTESDRNADAEPNAEPDDPSAPDRADIVLEAIRLTDVGADLPDGPSYDINITKNDDHNNHDPAR
jgi:hypothetical protein